MESNSRSENQAAKEEAATAAALSIRSQMQTAESVWPMLSDRIRVSNERQ